MQEFVFPAIMGVIGLGCLIGARYNRQDRKNLTVAALIALAIGGISLASTLMPK